MEINVNILRGLYEQYFCNVCELTDEQLISLHFKCNESLDNNEDLFWDDYPLTETIIWQPFKDVLPVHVFDNILEGHKRLWEMHDQAYNQICLDLSVAFAEEKLEEYYENNVPEIQDENGDIRLTEEAQDKFIVFQQEFDDKIRGYTQKP